MFIVQYWLNFYKYTGKKLWLIILLSPLVGILDAVGLSLIIPFAVNLISGAGVESENVISSLLIDLGFDFSPWTIFYLIFFVFVAKLILRYVHLVLSAQISADFVLKLRSQLVKLIISLDYRHYTTVKTGHLLNTTTGEATKYATTQKAYVESISFLFILVGYAVLIVLNSWKSSLVLVLLGLSFNQIYRLLNSITKGLSRSIITYNREYNAKLIEMVSYFKYLKSTARFDFFGKKLETTTVQSARIQFRNTLVNGIPNVIQEVVILIMIGLLWLINYYVIQEPIEIILIILAIGYRASGTLSQFQSRKQMFYSGVGSIEAVTKLVKEFSAFGETDSGRKDLIFTKSISLERVSVVINNLTILQDVSVKIPANKMVAFVGSSGAGKTTLVDIIAGVLKPDQGNILLDGRQYTDLATNAWRSQVGYITQESMVFDGSVLENITMHNGPEHDVISLNQAIAWSRCDEFLHLLPNGLETQLGERGIKLSGGQRQRIAIARELYKMPSILIMDEATSSLDTESEKIIQLSIDNLKGRITTIIVAHRLSTIKNADLVYVMNAGKIIEKGTYENLMNDEKGLFNHYVRLQKLS
ncbi:MAG: ABC transporter ATP-binding protein [Cyclobacteriaceae bacterium]|nr:ABC transporter ATP-binding protein [Cyclobacteriaceae bacterium]